MPVPLALVLIGCGSRGVTYSTLAAKMPHKYRVVALADPRTDRLVELRKIVGDQARTFDSAAACFEAGKLGDVALVCTQDHDHVEHTIQALRTGYDVLVEKPVGTSAVDALRVRDAARRAGHRVLVCHVLRYSPLWVKLKQIIDEGSLGEIVTLDHHEGVGDWHQVHSFVRGHWSVSGKSNPMIISKSCHDTDIISWLMARPCQSVSSFGQLTFFRRENAPPGATDRCTDGCPHVGTCLYDAHRYLGEHKNWLRWVNFDADRLTDAQILEWLKTSPWGRCAWKCDNDVVDHQVVSMQFAGGRTGTFTMTAFDHGRNITLCGTRATLYAGTFAKKYGGSDILIHYHTGDTRRHDVNSAVGGYAGHGGGDPGLIMALADELAVPDPRDMRTGIDASVESHLIGYAAEESRLNGGRVVNLAEYARALHAGETHLPPLR